MRELELTNEELELLSEELNNSKIGRLKEIRNGILILSISSVGTVVFWLLTEHLPFANKLMDITLFGIALGAYKSYWWYMNASIEKLELDFQKRLKIQDESIIKSYRKRTHTVKLLNGFRLNDFDTNLQNISITLDFCYYSNHSCSIIS